jgi:hypothetical protein
MSINDFGYLSSFSNGVDLVCGYWSCGWKIWAKAMKNKYGANEEPKC